MRRAEKQGRLSTELDDAVLFLMESWISPKVRARDAGVQSIAWLHIVENPILALWAAKAILLGDLVTSLTDEELAWDEELSASGESTVFERLMLIHRAREEAKADG